MSLILRKWYQSYNEARKKCANIIFDIRRTAVVCEWSCFQTKTNCFKRLGPKSMNQSTFIILSILIKNFFWPAAFFRIFVLSLCTRIRLFIGVYDLQIMIRKQS